MQSSPLALQIFCSVLMTMILQTILSAPSISRRSKDPVFPTTNTTHPNPNPSHFYVNNHKGGKGVDNWEQKKRKGGREKGKERREEEKRGMERKEEEKRGREKGKEGREGRKREREEEKRERGREERKGKREGKKRREKGKGKKEGRKGRERKGKGKKEGRKYASDGSEDEELLNGKESIVVLFICELDDRKSRDLSNKGRINIQGFHRTNIINILDQKFNQFFSNRIHLFLCF